MFMASLSITAKTVETTQMSTNRRMDKPTVVNSCSTMLFINKEEKTLDKYNTDKKLVKPKSRLKP